MFLRKGTYHDSAFLMRLARDARAKGVSEAVVLMATPMNRRLLVDAGFAEAAVPDATPMDVVVALRGESDAALDAAEKLVWSGLEGGGTGETKGVGAAEEHAATFGEAFAAHPEVNLASVAVPGPYAAFVARRAIEAGRHVFLFSNNVPIEDEIELKKLAIERGLLVMGPDCGTAVVAGVGLGFANRVPRGRVGIVGASGTGIQEICCALARTGEGVSHAIGTGSRDLSREVGGATTALGLRLLADDEGTKAVVLVAKHPHPEVAARLDEIAMDLGKPVVVRYLGEDRRPEYRGATYALSLDEAAALATAIVRGDPLSHVAPMVGLADALRDAEPVEGRLVGLFGGGSLAAEARVVLRRCGIDAVEPERPLVPGKPVVGTAHLVVDTGDEVYTAGRPHPMIDQTVRCALIRAAGADASVGVLLLDLVLGDGSHPDPAPEIAAAIADARAARKRPLTVVCSVCGTDADPQNASRQAAILREAGVHVQQTAARAATLAAAYLSAGVAGGLR